MALSREGRSAMIAVAVVMLLFLALGVAGMRWGADTRDGRDWQPAQTPSLDWCASSPRHSRGARRLVRSRA